MSRDHGSNFFEGVFFGAIIGAILGVLYAPQSGDKTRRWIQDVKDEHQEEIDGAVEKSEELLSKTKGAIEDGIEKISTLIDEKTKDIKKKKK